MRSPLLGATLLAGATALVPAAAEAAWCLNSPVGGTLCRFQTFEQCMASVVTRGDTCHQDLSAKPAAPRSRTKTEAAPAKPATPAPAAAAAPPPAPQPAKVPPPAPKKLDPTQFAEARKLVLGGQYEAGLAAMRALEFDEHPDVASFTGLAYRKLGKNDEAKSWYDKALAANPRHLQTLAYYGVLRAEEGDVAGARKDLERIRAICGNTTCNEYLGLSGVIASRRR